jgi:tRNA acetyltransferase TAN1
MKTNGGNDATRLFTPVKLNIECVLFVKTKPPVEPVDFVKRICEAARGGDKRKTRYVNRLTPVVSIGKATEQGIVEVARKVLAPWFDLSGKKAGVGAEGEAGSGPLPVDSDKPKEGAESVSRQSANDPNEASNDAEGLGETPAEHRAQGAAGVEATRSYSVSPLLEAPASARIPRLLWLQYSQKWQFAIRPSIRRSDLKQLDVINQIANLINDDRHKVNLKAPDKVILVDIYQVTLPMLQPSSGSALRVGSLTRT